MEKKLIKLCEEGHNNELAKTVQEIPNQELTQMIENRALRGKGEVLPLLQAILQGISATEPRNVNKCVSVYTNCINLLEKNEMSNKDASNVVGLLMLEADGLPGTALTELSTLFIDLVKNGQAQCGKGLELLPKILSALANEETVIYGDNSMSGTEYKGHVLNSLCACRWNAQSVIYLAGMFKDVTMTLDELKFVMEKMLRMLKELEHADLPALVYQLLLLSAKGHQRLVIEGITAFFIEQDKTFRYKTPNELSEDLMEDDNEETVRHIEGTIILHISFATKLDHNLGKEFIKFLKGRQQGCATQVLAPFNLALALSLSCIHRFEDQIFDFLKVTILKSFKDCDKQDQSSWVREVVPQSCHIQALVLETIQNSVYGWDHVIQGLVQLGFVLMDSFGPKAAFGRLEETTSVPSNTPSHRACQLGSKILLHTFKAHEMVRVDILEHIFNRVVTKATCPVSHYLELLASTVMSAPQILLESTPKVREMFDYLSFLTPTSAAGLLNAIQPLLKFSMSLKDALILVLRKAMFSRQLDSRKIGVNGFLMILKHFRVLGGLQPSQTSQSVSSSQIQVDVHARYNPSSNEALCLEIMGNLRRVLTQQADVRLIFYEGIYRVLCRNSQLQGPVLDILLSQLKKYYEPSEDVNPPLKLDLCISAQGDQVYLQEPLAHLLACVQLSLLKISDIRRQQTDDAPDNEPHILAVKSEVEDMMESITQRMVKSDMEYFELDKAADFSLGNSVGVKNNIFAILVLGTYEVLMEYTFQAGQFSMNSTEELLELYENYHKLGSVLKEKANAVAGKKGKGPVGKGPAGKAPRSMMSLDCVSAILDAIINDKEPSHRESVQVLRDNMDFRKYVMGVALQRIQQVQDKGVCDGLEAGDSDKILRLVCSLGSAFLKHYSENQKPGEEGKRNRSRGICGQCLEGLVSIVTILTQQHKDQLASCLGDILGAQDSDNHQDVIYSNIKKFQRLVMNLLAVEEDDHNWKEVTHLLTIIQLLCRELTATNGQFEKVLDWIHKICTEQTIDDLSTCKLLFGMLLEMTQQRKSCPPYLRDMAQDIHTQLGDIDQEVEVEDRTHHASITARTAAPTILLLVLQQIERELDDTEWAIARIKADTLSETPNDDMENLTQREGHEKSICSRVGILVTAFHELIQSAIPVGVGVEAMIKQATRLFGTLTLLVKYYIAFYHHVTARFEKLIKLTGTHLTQHCYAMITYIQTSESEHIQHIVEKHGKKDKKKASAAAQAGRAKVMKQSRTIPNLIFAIETFEKFLIQLSKKSKINLMEHIKVSTSRDFRINTAAVQEVMADGSESDSDGDDNDSDENVEEDNTVVSDDDKQSGSEEDQENQEPVNKRPCLDNPAPAPAAKVNKLGKKKKTAVKK